MKGVAGRPERRKRRTVLGGFVLLAILALHPLSQSPSQSIAHASQPPPAASDHPSVLLLFLPGAGTDLGCYRGTARTPQLDRIARKGALFERAYVQYPAGEASRTSLMLGMRPETTEIWSPPEASRLEDAAPLQERLHAAGYRTVRVGAVYGGAAEAAAHWDVAEDARSGEPGRRVAALLEANQNAPLFLAASLGDSTTLDSAGTGTASAALGPVLPAIAGAPAPVPHPGRMARAPGLSPEQRRVRAAAADGRVGRLDEQAGFILDALDRLNLWSKVLVVLVADHGTYLGTQGDLRRSDLLFESTLRTAMVFEGPGVAPGRRAKVFAELVDVYPTLLDICHVAQMKDAEGTSLAAALQDPEAPGKGAAFSVVERDAGHVGRSVRTNRYRFTEWPDGSEELYDHDLDPNEWTNLAMTPSARPAIGELRKLMEERDRTAAPPAALPRKAGAPTRRPNVLFMIADDLTVHLGAYGYAVKTPNIDRLAKIGRRFDRAYAQIPTCSPSRTSLMTSWRPERIDLWTNALAPRPKIAGSAPLEELFHSNGYFTARVGKVYHGPWEDEFRWDLAEFLPAPAGSRLPGGDATASERGEGAGEDEGEGGSWWLATDNADADEPDGRRARRVAELLEQKRDRPFFIGLGFAKPHLRWIAPRRYFDLYSPDAIQVPPVPPSDLDDVPLIALTRNRPIPSPRTFATGRRPDLDEAQRRQALAAYYACVSFVDAQVGVVLSALDRYRLWDDTIVVLIGDHGFLLGEHGLWRKDTLFEADLRTPLIVAAPQVQRKGVASSEIVEFLDIYPTVAELAGLAIPAGVQGRSLVPMLQDPDSKGSGAAFSFRRCAPPRLGRTVRTEHYRLTEWPDGAIELYDAEQDPDELRNLAADPAYAGAVAEMKRVLDAGPGAPTQRRQ